MHAWTVAYSRAMSCARRLPSQWNYDAGRAVQGPVETIPRANHHASTALRHREIRDS